MSKKKHKKQQQRFGWLQKWPVRTRVIASAVAAVVLLFVVASVMAYLFINQNSSESQKTDQVSKKETWDEYSKRLERNGALRDDAAKILQDGNEQKAQEVYDDALKMESDATRKVQLMIEKSKFLYDTGKYDEAVAVAKDAEILSEDKYLVASWLAHVFEQAKDYKNATHYYTLAGEWAQSGLNYAKFDKAYYDRQASRVALLVEDK